MLLVDATHSYRSAAGGVKPESAFLLVLTLDGSQCRHSTGDVSGNHVQAACPALVRWDSRKRDSTYFPSTISISNFACSKLLA